MKKKLYKLIFVSALMITSQAKTVFSQNQPHCNTTEMNEILYSSHPELLENANNYNKLITKEIQNNKQLKSSQSSEPVYTIPLVFHIIHINGIENISDAQVLDEVAVLNRDFAKLNADTANIVGNTPFDTISGNMNIKFRLARLDPNGNCTNGIDRIYSHKTNYANDESKLNPWPRDKYLNIWVINTMEDVGTAGYAYFPANTEGLMAIKDGIIILHNFIGRIGTGSEYNSRALTHEIGHYLSLYHTWGQDNSAGVACGDDLVDDTPTTKGHNLSCTQVDLYGVTCGSNALAPSYNFASVTPVSGTTDTANIAATTGATFGHFSAEGVSANSNDSSIFAFTKWDTGAPDNALVYDSLTGSINTAKYYEVTVTPAYGSSMTLTGLNFNFKRSATGVRTYAVRSSANGYASNLAASVANTSLSIQGSNVFFSKYDTTNNQSGNIITLSGTPYTNTITPITFRFYGWNAEDSLGTFGIDNVNFSGSAGTIENTQNYMDYSYCSVMFTRGQKERMRTALELSVGGRNHLWKTSNLIATGTDDAGQALAACIPHPDFYSTTNSNTNPVICNTICAGGSLKFNKNITLGTATNTVWSFDGGTPATSTAANPVVTYPTPGDYAVKLTASNATGADSVIKDFYIHVSQPWTQYTGLASEAFEGPTSSYYNWYINNYDYNDNFWALTSATGYSGNHSMVMYGYNNYPFDVDDFVTPSFDLSYMNTASLTFRCAGASKALVTANLNDVLKIYSSSNCGQTWNARATIQGNVLNNNNYHPESFQPNTPGQWALHTVTLPNSLTTDNIRFKFEYTSGNASNNIYIDNINITGVLGISENSIENANVSIYPNPSSQMVTITYHLNKKGNIKIELLDLLGKKITDITNKDQSEGDYNVAISKEQHGISNGIYFIKLSIDNTSVTKN